MSRIFENLLNAGLSVIPVRTDGSKRPAIASWAEYQHRIATHEEAAKWQADGVAIIGGVVSGGVTCIDIDTKHDPLGTIFQEFTATAQEWGLTDTLSKCAIEQTPSGGWHVVFRSPVRQGCEKLAKAKGATEAMIETKAEGGYFIIAPTKDYTLKNGNFEDLPTLSETEAQSLLTLCWGLDRNEPEIMDSSHASGRVAQSYGTCKSPFDDYSEKVGVNGMLDLLLSHGWKQTGKRGENIHLGRPGKDGKHTAATLHLGKGVFYVHSTSTEFQEKRGYGPAGVYAILEHGGDFKAAARQLAAQGYGEKKEEFKVTTGAKVPTDSLVDELLGLYEKPFYPGESTGWPELDKILRVEKGQMNILFGVPSHGKSSFLDAMMVNLAFNSGWRAAIFSPENKSRAYHASKLCEILCGKPFYGQGRMTNKELAEAGAKVAEKFTFILAADGGATLDNVLDRIKEIKPDMAVVDPWNRMIHVRPDSITETEYIGQSLARTSALAKAIDTSFWYVVHPQKLRRDKNGDIMRPGFYEVAGSAHWANMADNGILVWRDFENGWTEIETAKVRYRHNGSVGMVKMRFERGSGRFIPVTQGQEFTQGAVQKSNWWEDK